MAQLEFFLVPRKKLPSVVDSSDSEDGWSESVSGGNGGYKVEYAVDNVDELSFHNEGEFNGSSCGKRKKISVGSNLGLEKGKDVTLQNLPQVNADSAGTFDQDLVLAKGQKGNVSGNGGYNLSSIYVNNITIGSDGIKVRGYVNLSINFAPSNKVGKRST